MAHSTCPSCNNKYQSFEYCPECEVPLQAPDDIPHKQNSHNIQKTKIGGDNNGNVVNGPATIHQHAAGHEQVHFHNEHVTTYPSIGQMAMPGIKQGIGAAAMGLFQWLGGLASILAFFGITAPLIGFWNIIFFFITLGIAGLAAIRLIDAFKLTDHQWVRRFSKLYLKHEDGNIEELRVTAKCPVAGCPGTITLGRPAANEEGVDFAGICSKHGSRHAFEFNDETYIGSRIYLTPLKTDKQ